MWSLDLEQDQDNPIVTDWDSGGKCLVFAVIKMKNNLSQHFSLGLLERHQAANIYLMAVNNNLKTISEDDLEF